MIDILIDENNIEQIEFVKRFLNDIRREFSEYRGDTMLQHQAISNVIWLLSDRINKLTKKVNEE